MKKTLNFTLIHVLFLITLVFVCCGHEHEWGEWETTTNATCTAEGSMQRVCECGEKETKSVAALGHTNGEWTIDSEATCVQDGSKHQADRCCGLQKVGIHDVSCAIR